MSPDQKQLYRLMLSRKIFNTKAEFDNKAGIIKISFSYRKAQYGAIHSVTFKVRPLIYQYDLSSTSTEQVFV